MLSYKSGDGGLRKIRQTSDSGYHHLTKDRIHIKIDLLTIGADDSITKPFDLEEVAARVQTNLRRYHKIRKEEQYTYRELMFEPESGRAFILKYPLN